MKIKIIFSCPTLFPLELIENVDLCACDSANLPFSAHPENLSFSTHLYRK